jgi:tryptophan-rich sensory protein
MGELASKGQLRASFLRVAIITVPLVLLLGTLSGTLSNSGYQNPWFAGLEKPVIMPPGAAFGIVWPILYVMLGLAVAIIWFARGAQGRGLALGLFVIQLLVNYTWSPLFFGAHQVSAAFWLILLLIPLVIATVIAFARIRPVAAVLLLPYLAWLCFAAVLNWQIDRLNPDAEQGTAQSVEYEL